MRHAFGIGSIIASLACIIIYHLYFFSKVFLTGASQIPLTTNFATNVSFILKHREKPDAPSVTLAIQTFRNTILVAIFIGGYSLQYANSAVNMCTAAIEIDVKVANGIIALFMFLSFLAWATVIRAAAHLGYHIGTLANNFASQQQKTKPPVELEVMESGTVPTEETDEQKELEKQLQFSIRLMNYVTTSFSLGFRFIFIAIPFFFFSVGPIVLLIATVIILAFLMTWDTPLSLLPQKRVE